MNLFLYVPYLVIIVGNYPKNVLAKEEGQLLKLLELIA